MTIARDGAPAHRDATGGSAWLMRGFARSVRDNTIGEIVVQLTRVAGIIFLARHLEPADFGLYRILLVVCALAMLTNEAGIPEALIQRRIVTPDHEATGFWANCAIGSALTAILFAAAPLIARVLLMPSLTAQVRLLCLPILLIATSAAGNARLRRAFRFGSLALADSAGELTFFAVALTILLHFDAPRWSLAGGLAAKLIVQAITVWIASAYLPARLPKARAARDLARFASTVWGGRAIVTLSANADYLLIGRFLGSTALGFYSIAWDLLRFIPDRLYKVVGRVTLPLFSQMQDDDTALRRRYCEFVGHISRIVLPPMAFAAVAAPEVVVVVYGARWSPAAGPMRALAIALALVGVAIAIGSLYCAKNRPVIDLYLHTARLILILITVTACARFGLLAASIGMGAVEATVAIAGQWLACELIGLDSWRLLLATLPGLRSAAVAAVAAEAGKLIAAFAGLHGVQSLAVIAALPALCVGWLEMPFVIGILRGTMGAQVASHSPL